MKRPPQLFTDIEAAGNLLEYGDDGCRFLVRIPNTEDALCCIASWGGKWDHVSIHAMRMPQDIHGCDPGAQDDAPTWDEMCLVKEICFMPNEWAIQYHPAHEDYVNHHPHTLHIWKPQTKSLPKPPKNFI